MDAEHRHELKTNELATLITRLPEWMKNNVNMILGLALILVGLITWPMLSNRAKENNLSQQMQATNSIQQLESDVVKTVTDKDMDIQAKQQALSMLLVNADALLEQADKIENPDLAAISRIKAAQAYRTELQLRPQEVPADVIETQVKKAQTAYQAAFDQAKTAPIKAMAELGLALCTEELGQIDQASAMYDKIIKNEAYAGTVVPVQAQDRLKVLRDKVSKIYFAPTPEPVTEVPAAAPTIEAAEQIIQEKARQGTMAPAEIPAAQAPEKTVPAEQTPAPAEK